MPAGKVVYQQLDQDKHPPQFYRLPGQANEVGYGKQRQATGEILHAAQ